MVITWLLSDDDFVVAGVTHDYVGTTTLILVDGVANATSVLNEVDVGFKVFKLCFGVGELHDLIH